MADQQTKSRPESVAALMDPIPTTVMGMSEFYMFPGHLKLREADIGRTWSFGRGRAPDPLLYHVSVYTLDKRGEPLTETLYILPEWMQVMMARFVRGVERTAAARFGMGG